MNGNSGSEVVMSAPSIRGPYQSPQQTEAFPLKQSLYGSARSKEGRLLSGCCDKGGASLRMIIICFVVLTLTVLVALAIQIYYGDYQLVPHGSVATDSHVCSTVGTDILKVGGNAVDAAIAATFCMGVVNPHVTGLGGGGFMIIYSHRSRKVLDVIDFREVAPATVNVSNTVGVPGFLRGLSLGHRLHGRLPWKQLIMPSVQIARLGYLIPETLAKALSQLPPGSELFEHYSGFQAGQNKASPRLAAMLELVADKGADVFYNGSLSRSVVQAGYLTAQDLAAYQAERRLAMEDTFSRFRVIVPGLPSGGPALLEILKLLPDLNSTVLNMIDAAKETYKVMLEEGKWGDPNFLKYPAESGGIDINLNLTKVAGSHVAAVDLNDIYVSVVSGLNSWWGSKLLVDESFVLNNALDNFGVGKNRPLPGRRPLSYATPVIAVEYRRVCGRRLVFGSSDTTLALQILSRLMLDTEMHRSIEAPRFHLENINNMVYLEGQNYRLEEDSVNDLLKFYQVKNLLEPYQSSNLIEKFADNLASHSDSRGGGVASRF